ncbi:WXG100 family type VII secretion target [Nonomuraea sp. NPDC046802]|uniref:WXG100 family type VII secretion target n=1 Tax=Nonomuraea sp. NPDC046802 TaxID=3154919 RepID=UPI0033C2C646
MAEQPTRYVEGSIESAADRARLAHGNIQQIYNRLEAIPATLSEHWKGASADTFKAVWNEWMPQFHIVLRELNEIADRLQGTGVQYTEATTTANDVVARLRSQLDATAPSAAPQA